MSKYLWILLLAGVWGEGYAQEGDELTGDGDTGTAQAETGSAGTAVIYGMLSAYQCPKIDTVTAKVYTGRLWKDTSKRDYFEVKAPIVPGNVYEGARTGVDKMFDLELKGLQGVSYIELSTGTMHNYLTDYMIRPGDTLWLNIDLQNGMIRFGGPAAIFFRSQYLMEWQRKNNTYARDPSMIVKDKNKKLSSESTASLYSGSRIQGRRQLQLIERGTYLESWMEERFDHLVRFYEEWDAVLPDSYLSSLTPDIQSLLKAEGIGVELRGMASSLRNSYFSVGKDTVAKGELDKLYHRYLEPYDEFLFEPEVVLHSKSYRRYLSIRAAVKGYVEGQSFIESLISLQIPSVRDALIGQYFVKKFTRIAGLGEWLPRVLEVVEDPSMRKSLIALLEKMKKEKVEPLSLPDMEGKTVDIRDLEGKVVLLDFWFTGCKPCIWFHKMSLSKVKEHFAEEEDFAVLSVSVDQSRNTWLKSVTSGQYTSDTAINVHMKGRDHPFLKAYGITGYPSILLIDKEGRTTGLPVVRDAEEMIEVIEKELE